MAVASGRRSRAGYAIASLVPEHLAEVKRRRLAEIDKVEREVRARLTREINYWDARAARLREEERAGKEQRINAPNAEATAQRLVERLHKRQDELDRERQITRFAAGPEGCGAGHPEWAAAIPGRPSAKAGGALGTRRRPRRPRRNRAAGDGGGHGGERALGNVPRDVSAEKKGYDIESRDPRSGHLRFIEVKGRHADGRDVIVTKNEILASLNAPEAFLLALVIDNWRDVFDESFSRNEKHRVRNFVSTALEARNATSHLSIPLRDDEALRYLDAIHQVLRAVKAPAAEIAEAKRLYDEQRQSGVTAPAAVPAPAAAPAPAPEPAADKPGKVLRPWIEVALPHPDVLANRFKEAEFAADLFAVDAGNADEDYATPRASSASPF